MKELTQLLDFLKETRETMYRALDFLPEDESVYLDMVSKVGRLTNVISYLENPEEYQSRGYRKPW